MKKIIFIFLFLFFSSCSNSQVQEKENIEKWNLTQTQKTILALGDSLTAWYWVDLNENYPYLLEQKLWEKSYNYKVINWWISWDTSDWLKSRASLYLSQNPDIVIIVIWWNDWLRWLSTENLKNNILEIVDIFSDWNRKIIIWWMDIPANLGSKYRSDFKNVYHEVSKERKDIYFLDYFLDWVWWIAKYNLNDRIHPNLQWYEIIVDNLYDFLVKNKILEK